MKKSAEFTVEKETKNTIRFAETPSGPPIMNTVYVQKWVINEMGNPQKIRVTIEVVE